MAKDIKRISAFRRKAKYIDRILTIFERTGFSVEYVYDDGKEPHSWGVHLAPNEDLIKELGSRTELLLWVDYYDEFQPRSVTRITRVLESARPRLREDVAFFVSGDTRVSELVASLPSKTTIISFSIAQLKTFNVPIGPDFRRHLLSRVFARDPYQLTGAVAQDWQFFGRSNLLAELVTSASSGRRLGLFGLRKIGKTSLLLRLIDQLRIASTNMVVAHLQVARVDAIRKTASYFLWSLGQSLHLSLPKAVRIPTLRLFGRYSIFADLHANEEQALPELFLHDMSLLLRKASLRFCLVLDEIERMWPNAKESSTQQWTMEFPKIWQILRSLDQEFPSRMSIVVAGTNPQCAEESKIGDLDNPLFQYLQVRYLQFLEKEDAYTLLKDLGARAGLHWTDDACKLAYEQVAGHPALLRVLGSVVYEQGREHERRRLISESNVVDATNATRRESSPILSEICGALREGYPDDFMLLEALAHNRIGEYRQYRSAFPESIQHLRGFGLVSDGDQPALSFSLLQAHLQSLARARPPTSNASETPEVIDNYQVLTSLGRAGGFGKVFRCQDGHGRSVAIKLLHSASLNALNREVDILKSMEHESIVKFIDSGHSDLGNYIVMEYLDGHPWSNYCTRATRMNSRDAKNEMIKLLRALHYLHPKGINPEEISDELSLQELLARNFGYVHRDIKPENIIAVPRRGPVLIDFGIASKSGDPTKTTSATPGYLPPDFVAGVWDPDIDLFQLGLTFLQVLVGEQFTGGLAQLEDLREVFEADPSIPKQIKEVVLRMCEIERADRFRSASKVLSHLGV